MRFVHLSIVLLLISGVLPLALGASRAAKRIATLGAVFAGGLGLIGAIIALITGRTEQYQLAWSAPYMELHFQLDPLSAFFLIPICLLTGLAAIYGEGYLHKWEGTLQLKMANLFYNVLFAMMMLVVIAGDGLLFLIAWEVMSLTAFFLVTFEDEKESVRKAGWTYLMATHVGTAFIIVLFILLSCQSGNLSFSSFVASANHIPASLTGLLFVLAIIGFGTKAGFMPLHIWLPEAHPAAPSHVSAVMSAVMVKTGIYGLVRTLTFLGPPAGWWFWLLIGIGIVSATIGILFAVNQHDIKRMLAYSTIENVGIITIGLGLGLFGQYNHLPLLTFLGFGGAFFHILNHAIFKGLLFLAAGSVYHATGTREIDTLGGLLKRMPWTGRTFLVGAVAISGLPPLNGFISEFLIYAGALVGCVKLHVEGVLPCLGIIISLALVGGLAATCFAKVFGITFLGEYRGSQPIENIRESSPSMRRPMIILAAACFVVALLAPALPYILARPISLFWSDVPPNVVADTLRQVSSLLLAVVGGFVLLGALIYFVASLRIYFLQKKDIAASGTWDCGYARPTPRMQYTGSSFVQPINELFSVFLQTRREGHMPIGFFPKTASFVTRTPDIFMEYFYRPCFRKIENIISAFRWLQHGHMHIYVLYIALTLLGILIWQFGIHR